MSTALHQASSVAVSAWHVQLSLLLRVILSLPPSVGKARLKPCLLYNESKERTETEHRLPWWQSLRENLRYDQLLSSSFDSLDF